MSGKNFGLFVVASALGLVVLPGERASAQCCPPCCAAKPTIKISTITDSNVNCAVSLKLTANVTGKAGANYWIKLEAVQGKNDPILLDKNTAITINCKGTFVYLFGSTSSGLAFGTKYTFNIYVYPTQDTTSCKAKPVAQGTMDYTTGTKKFRNDEDEFTALLEIVDCVMNALPIRTIQVKGVIQCLPKRHAESD